MEWISVKDRLPEKGKGYLVLCEEGICTAIYDNYKHWIGDNYAEESSNSPYYIHVTHWMPLPSPPKDL